ncbi:hypothetical protein [Salipiger aestuarii]|uniref:hypothetical protein n=1 Tax=Salipiger aestuarii TaxID=568098 RepID=UPI00123B0361|nr:hypothetical protein [Salipiger aestuarii]
MTAWSALPASGRRVMLHSAANGRFGELHRRVGWHDEGSERAVSLVWRPHFGLKRAAVIQLGMELKAICRNEA